MSTLPVNRHCGTPLRAACGLRLVLILWALCAFLTGGCRTVPPLPAADLEAGWLLRHGQAVWTRSQTERGVAGEILLATRADRDCFVQFAKPPFTLATARAEAGLWSVESAASRRRSKGRGVVPPRVVWFALAEEVRGRPAGCGWRFEGRSGAEWRLTNAITGEGLEGFLAP